MSLSKKRRSGKKNLGSTRNQRRKSDYAAMVGQEWRKHKKMKTRADIRLVGTKKPHVDCGNPACRKCFVRIPGRGIYRPGQVRAA